MSDSDEIVNEILEKTKPGFRKAASRLKEDAVKSRAKAQGQSRDLSYVRAKLAPKAKADATVPQPDAGDVILDIMGSKGSTFAPIDHRDTRIVKIENDEGQKTRAVLDVTGKKKIGEAS
jgi:hypothetical protein